MPPRAAPARQGQRGLGQGERGGGSQGERQGFDSEAAFSYSSVFKILCRLDKTYNDECKCDCFYLGNNRFLMRNSTYKSGKIVCVSRNRKNHFIS